MRHIAYLRTALMLHLQNRMHIIIMRLHNPNSKHSQNPEICLPAQDLVLHIFIKRMMIANRCDTSPARRKTFMLLNVRQKQVKNKKL